MPQKHELRCKAEPGDTVAVHIETPLGVRDYAYDVKEDGTVKWYGQGFYFNDGTAGGALGTGDEKEVSDLPRDLT